MPVNGRRDLIRRLKVNYRLQLRICKKNTNMENENGRRKWSMYDAWTFLLWEQYVWYQTLSAMG